MQLVECVPNFSVGSDLRTVERIATAISDTAQVELLLVDSSASVNRTVITFVGTPTGVIDAAFAAIKVAAELIDMQKHHGIHPRIGATDVCPLIPLHDISVSETVELANTLASRVANELQIPTYLYASAAKTPARKSLRNIRRGQYEGLSQKLARSGWQPDFGPNKLKNHAGATIIGVRDILVAYNINVETDDVELVRDIARHVRTSGHVRTDIRGELEACQADAWWIPEFGCAQVTANLSAYRRTGLVDLYRQVESHATARGLKLRGSELVGMVPKQALTTAARSLGYDGHSWNGVVDTVNRELALDSVKAFGNAQVLDVDSLLKNQLADGSSANSG